MSATDREWLAMIEQRRVGPVPIDDDLLAKRVRLRLVNDGGEHPELTTRGRAMLTAAP